ncbi:putative MFS family arabinose efflux permease [Geodermatophilus normandii]|uniref:Putative MFS family arabinose efflux permease n=1 Tax=Geodermatophilus normandii TaxID=1137989 RepID=A0A317QM06_9ACTN|nr:MFS transporter [Geodermatophilus normandii]PWW24069.1 putative MFS family arabinose efflux permease [Geodermatophilus normandii]
MLDAATERDRRRRLDALTFGLFTVALGTNIPTPLLLVYRRTLGLSDADLTAVFGCYAIGLVAALTVAGAASDRFGRRALVLPFAVLAGLASLLFVPAAGSLPLLYTGRLLQGVVSGVVFSVANAWLQELAGPDAQQSAATRGAVSSSLGFAVAPAMSGLLAQYGPAPTTLPYLVHVGVLLVGLGALLVVPETVRERRPGRLMTLGLPPEARRPFRAVLAPTAVGVFAFPAVAATVLPLLVVPDGVGVAYAGLVGGLALGASAVAARVGRRFERGAAPLGMLLGAIGIAIGVAAVVTRSEPLLLPSSALMGGGAGLCLTAGLTLTARLAPPHTRGAMNSAFYAFAYAGFGTPLLLAWLGSQVGTVAALSAFAAVPLALAGWLALELRR